MKYSIYGKSLNEKGKAKCGDFFLHHVLKDENLVVLALSDGVGSRHHDYIASQTACNEFIESFFYNKSLEINQRFELAIKEADKQVSNPLESSYKGMMSTFVGVVWDIEENTILYDSIGDSRLYKFSISGLEQISSDSKKAILMRDRSGKLIKQNGVLVTREGLTNALGYNGAEIKIKQTTFNSGEAFILCSDGMYDISDFEKSLSESLLNLELDISIEKFVNKNQEYFDDDATILIIRRSDQPENYKNLYNKTIQRNIDFRQNNIIAHLFSDYLQSEILTLIKSKQESLIKQYTLYIEKYYLKLSKEFIETAIQSMKANNFVVSELYQLLLKRLRELNW
ncbi:MAG: protein phosphatase 2C domain-containing protein [Bacteroidetes bacterium]|nr:protein phosphatase 2C domain-containing protein [Bacteroidota bacterium]